MHLKHFRASVHTSVRLSLGSLSPFPRLTRPSGYQRVKVEEAYAAVNSAGTDYASTTSLNALTPSHSQ